jgi:hypothetical protein
MGTVQSRGGAARETKPATVRAVGDLRSKVMIAFQKEEECEAQHSVPAACTDFCKARHMSIEDYFTVKMP